ncbi:hypothetical protein JNW91_24640 [Micromonospora sp. STR1_7]|uniref:Uncharacterized protein n=1 Tax=Micromonospora parastrephiae TaxID=2806101 RepID=A0ABS1XZP6_9ACTN|nr:hypothetical protein [Micromonospora parastrephiae]MBM0234722.1 hypothetical protein [Micromonospora parastrephiae]
MNGSAALWALIGGWSVWTLARRRPARLPRWVPMTLAFAASGSLFAWGGWKLPMTIIRPEGYVAAEYPVVAVLQHTLSIIAGLALLVTILSVTILSVASAPREGRQGWANSGP